jgi:DNA polymerase-3 subunit epsilon
MSAKEKVARRCKQLLNEGCVILDFETTGFVSPDVDIIEVAIVSHSGEVLLDTLLKPHRPIPYGASAVNGIYDEDVADAPTFIDMYPKLLRHLTGQPVVAYNYTFERDILAAVTARLGLPLKVNEWYCAMKAYSDFSGLFRSSKLTTACKREGIAVENAHAALGDCLMTLALMKQMADGLR